MPYYRVARYLVGPTGVPTDNDVYLARNGTTATIGIPDYPAHEYFTEVGDTDVYTTLRNHIRTAATGTYRRPTAHATYNAR